MNKENEQPHLVMMGPGSASGHAGGDHYHHSHMHPLGNNGGSSTAGGMHEAQIVSGQPHPPYYGMHPPASAKQVMIGMNG